MKTQKTQSVYEKSLLKPLVLKNHNILENLLSGLLLSFPRIPHFQGFLILHFPGSVVENLLSAWEITMWQLRARYVATSGLEAWKFGFGFEATLSLEV